MQNADNITIQDCELNMYRIVKQRALIKIVSAVLTVFLTILLVKSFFYWQTTVMYASMAVGLVNAIVTSSLDCSLFHDYKFWFVKLRELQGHKSILNHND